jgi:hypothetical protein
MFFPGLAGQAEPLTSFPSLFYGEVFLNPIKACHFFVPTRSRSPENPKRGVPTSLPVMSERRRLPPRREFAPGPIRIAQTLFLTFDVTFWYVMA